LDKFDCYGYIACTSIMLSCDYLNLLVRLHWLLINRLIENNVICVETKTTMTNDIYIT